MIFRSGLFSKLALFLVSAIIICGCNVSVEIEDLTSVTTEANFTNSEEFLYDKESLKVTPEGIETAGVDLSSGANLKLDSLGGSIGIPLRTGYDLSTDSPQFLMKSVLGYWSFNQHFDSVFGEINSRSVPRGGVTIETRAHLGEGALRLNGSSGCLEVENESSLKAANSISVSVWVYLESKTNLVSFISKADRGSDGLLSFRLGLDDSSDQKFRLALRTEDLQLHSLTSDLAAPIGSWVQILGTYDGSVLKLFVNGKLSGSRSVSGKIFTTDISSATLQFGGHGFVGGSSPTFFHGFLDELGIWGRGFTDEEVKELFQTQAMRWKRVTEILPDRSDALVGYWEFENDGSDASALNNNGLFEGDGQIDRSLAKVGSGAAIFDGVGDYFEVPSTDSLELTQFTFSSWIRLESVSDLGNIVSKGGNSNFRLKTLPLNSGYRLRFFDRGATNAFTTVSRLEFRRWYHVAIVAGQDSIKLYIDGLLEAASPLPYQLVSSGQPLIIGARSSSQEFLDGAVDDVALWNELLTESEIHKLYRAQTKAYSKVYNSKIIKLGPGNKFEPGIRMSTSLPFGKGLTISGGGRDSSEAYPEALGTLQNQLSHSWGFEELTIDRSISEHFSSYGSIPRNIEAVGNVTENRNGVLGRSTSLDGSTGYLNLPDDLISPTEGTISVWFKPNTANGKSYVIGNVQNGSGDRLYLGLDSDRLYANIDDQPEADLGEVKLGEWYNYTVSWKPDGKVEIFVNGSLAEEFLGVTFSNAIGNNLNLGSYAEGTANFFDGEIDEFNIWERALNPTEIVELFRRFGNQTEIRVKNCVDSECKCEVAAASGLLDDCDGDGLLNAKDSEDLKRSRLSGPGGDHSTYYGEILNRDVDLINFFCDRNYSDLDSSLCKDDEVLVPPQSLENGLFVNKFSNLRNIDKPQTGYLQYEIELSSKSNIACESDIACTPQITEFTLNPSQATVLVSGPQAVTWRKELKFKKFFGFSQTFPDCVGLQISSDGETFSFWDGDSWESVKILSDVMRPGVLASTIGDFEPQMLQKEIYMRFILDSGNGEKSCAMPKFSVRTR